jgi:hypothetical protein
MISPACSIPSCVGGQYYGQDDKSALYPTCRVLDRILIKGAMRKYKKLKGHQRRATHGLGRMAQRQPASLCIGRWGYGLRLDDRSRMSREVPVRIWEGVGVKLPRATRRNIYVRSRQAGERVRASVSRFLTRKLRLTVNAAKSAVARPAERSFLGLRLANDGSLRSIAP